MQKISKNLTVGVLLSWPGVETNYQRYILKGIEDYAHQHCIDFLLLSTGRLESIYSWEKGRNRLFDFISPQRLDGLLVLTPSIVSFCGDDYLLDRLKSFGDLPIISMGSSLEDYPSVLVDNGSHIKEMVEHLVKGHGYGKLAYLGGPEELAEGRTRKDIVFQTAHSLGVSIQPDYYYQGNFLPQSAMDAVRYWLDEKRILPEAIICANDDMAITVWKELTRREISVPYDIAVTGFDNLKLSTSLDLALSTIEQPFYQMGYSAIEGVHKLMKGKSLNWDSNPLILPTKLIIKHSCGCSPLDQISYENKKNPWLEQQQLLILSLITDDNDALPESMVMKLWDTLLFKAMSKDVPQSVLQILFAKVENEVINLGGERISQRMRLLSTMKHMLLQRYIQKELFAEHNETYGVIFELDDLEHRNFNKKLKDIDLTGLKDILGNFNIEHCYISLLNEGDPSQSSARLVYAYQDGNVLEFDSRDAVFSSNNFIPPFIYSMQDKFHYEVNTLFKGERLLGFIVFDYQGGITRPHDTILSRISGVFNMMMNNGDYWN